MRARTSRPVRFSVSCQPASLQKTSPGLGADTVISLGGGAQMTLVGVQLSALGGAWILEG